MEKEEWINNRTADPNIPTFLEKITEKTTLHPFVIKAVTFGKKLKAEKKNMLVNHHILKSS